jgi:hypothetical protein
MALVTCTTDRNHREVHVRYVSIILATIFTAAAIQGCRQDAPPPRVPVPSAEHREPRRPSDPIRPVAPEAHAPPYAALPFFEDVPLLVQPPPEQAAFVDAYHHVGRPRIVLFVNRTLEGQIMPVRPHEPIWAREHVRRSTTGVVVEDRDTRTRRDYWGEDRRERVDRFETDGPGEYRETVEVYLRPHEYDEIAARQIDYQAMEHIMSDWLAANGHIELVAPTMARGRLTDEQIQELESGRPRMMSEIARELDSDVLVQVQARPTAQTPAGLELRVIAEAISLQGGQSIGRAVVDIPPPLDKLQMNRYTRFLARKLMDDMTGTWLAAGPVNQEPVEPMQPQN